MLRLPKIAFAALTVLLSAYTVGPVRAQQSAPRQPVSVDLGSLPDGAPVRRMQLVLSRSAVQEQKLEALLAEQQTAGSPGYHHWLTPAEFGQQFGPDAGETDRLIAWLSAQGFTGVKLSAGAR